MLTNVEKARNKEDIGSCQNNHFMLCEDGCKPGAVHRRFPFFFLAVLQPLKLTGRPQCSRDNSVAWEEKDDVMKADKPPIWASGEHLQNVGTPPVQAEALARGSCVHA